MDARLRESFLRELMILQSAPILSADPSRDHDQQHHYHHHNQQQPQPGQQQGLLPQPLQQSQGALTKPSVASTKQTTTTLERCTATREAGQKQTQGEQSGEQSGGRGHGIARGRNSKGTVIVASSNAPATSKPGSRQRQVDVTLFDESGSTGRTLSASFVACDTNLTHLLLNDLKTPIGTQPSALLKSSIKASNCNVTTLATNSGTQWAARPNKVVSTRARGTLSGAEMSEASFAPKRALVLRKFSRLEYERLCHPHLSEEQLAANLSQRGSAYDSLKHYDLVQKTCLQQIETTLATNDIDYQTVDKFGYTEEKINWADVIITSGGDGTFLMAASKVTTRDKPVIGINSDPTKSVGHLCLPSKYSNNFDKVIELLRAGKYQWQYKQRLRITLVGEAADEEAKQLNDIRCDLRGYLDQDLDQDRCQQQHHNHDHLNTPQARDHNHSKAYHEDSNDSCGGQTSSNHVIQVRTVDGKVTHKFRQLKERALNEVFVGETLSARVSYYELSIDNNKLLKMKSSGLTICTGTGSTSWYYNINKVTEQQVNSIVSIINRVTKQADKVDANNQTLIGDITRQFNETLTFSPTEPIMAYSIRDPIGYASAPQHSHRGHAKRIEVKSRMQNACLVLDGCQFYPFNDGSYALIEVHDEDALRTISIE